MHTCNNPCNNQDKRERKMYEKILVTLGLGAQDSEELREGAILASHWALLTLLMRIQTRPS